MKMKKLDGLLKRAKEALVRAPSRKGQVPITTGGGGREQLRDRPLAEPAVDVLEGDQDLLFLADVPGAGLRDVQVSIGGDSTLVLYAKAEEREYGAPLAGEYREADWYRSFRLPDGFDGDRARASLNHGVLSVRVPRRGESARKRIPVGPS